jgi:3-oxoacyl-[acyl-carrier protein] reductase
MPETIEWSDVHALVCGASSGIGRAAALTLARRGATVTALARTEDKLRSLADEAAPGNVRPLVADMDDIGALRETVAAHLSTTGPVHVLVNNSGGPPPGPLLDATTDDLTAAFGRHVLAAHVIVGLTLPGMREAGYGRIVNVISISVREPIPNLGVSNTIRAAMAGWAKSLSRELPPGITINNVLPGYTATDRLRQLGEAVGAKSNRTYEQVEQAWIATVPEGRLADPEETAGVIAFLASPEAAYVRGQSLAVDGGRLGCI